MIVIFTDFGIGSPYIGQMQNVLYRYAPDQAVITLFSDAPSFNPKSSAYLLPAYIDEFEAGTVFLCVVDPGVGDVTRKPVILQVDGRWFVGPDNGLFNVVAMRARDIESLQWWDITWQPDTLSNSFHGRDLFAPVAAMLTQGTMPEAQQQNTGNRIDRSWPAELEQIIYFDHFGNAITGVRATAISKDKHILLQQHVLRYARTFSDVETGNAFWYENANGLVEIAMNQGNVVRHFSLRIGDRIQIQ